MYYTSSSNIHGLLEDELASGNKLLILAIEVEISPSYIEDAFVGVFESKVEFAQEQVSDITDEIALPKFRPASD